MSERKNSRQSFVLQTTYSFFFTFYFICFTDSSQIFVYCQSNIFCVMESTTIKSCDAFVLKHRFYSNEQLKIVYLPDYEQDN